MKLWQLRKLSTGEALNDPQPLPENWGPVFGLHGFSDRLGDLSWLGPTFEDQGWFVVGEAPPGPELSSIGAQVWSRAKNMLAESDWSVLPDVPMSAGERAAWIEYRRSLREIKLQPGFPGAVQWPKAPD